MTAHDKNGAFNKVRFVWKKRINASNSVSRGAKQLASHLCDNYVNKHTGCCWPSNETLANDFSIDARTIQRWIKVLKRDGWLRNVRIKNVRRAFQICFPEQSEGDKEHDKLSPSCMTKLTSEDDITVTPYKNQVNNQRKERLESTTFPTVSIGNGEEKILRHWTNWMKENLEYDVSKMFELLRKGSSFFFPARFPKSDDSPIYHRFFRAVLESKGSILPGKSR